MISAPFVLMLGSARAYAAVMGVLLVLFLLRVVGQILVAVAPPRWLPPMARWYSGLMPYRYLLPTQLAFLILMTAMIVSVARQAPPLGTASPSVGAWIVWASYVYALGMVVRSVRYATAAPGRRGVLIPIAFHFVLAAFLFVYGSYLTGSGELRRRRQDRQRAGDAERAVRVVVPLTGRVRVTAAASRTDRDRRDA